MTSPRLSTPIGAPPKGSLRDDRRFLLVNLSLGHAMAHCFSQSFTVVLPYIQNYMGFGDLQYGLLLASRQLSQGAINIPLGFMIDALRRYWGLIFTGCMVGIALAFALAGSSPNYWVLVLAASFVAFPGSVWHLPAFALLSQRFPEKRGFALSTHSAGGNVGGTVGPLVAGLLLWLLISQEGGGEWRYVLFIFVAPALLMVLPIFWTLHNVGSSTEGIPHGTPLRQRISDASRLIRRPAILAIMAVLLLRGLGFNALNNWAPKYLEDGANQPAFWVGVDMALYIGLGIIFGPVLGTDFRQGGAQASDHPRPADLGRAGGASGHGRVKRALLSPAIRRHGALFPHSEPTAAGQRSGHHGQRHRGHCDGIGDGHTGVGAGWVSAGSGPDDRPFGYPHPVLLRRYHIRRRHSGAYCRTHQPTGRAWAS